MPSLNRVQLIGNLGRDAEARYTAKGTKYATFSLAVNSTWKSADGEKHEATDWFFVNAWGKLGDFAAQYLKKGRLVLIEGRLQTDRRPPPNRSTLLCLECRHRWHPES